MTDNAIESCCNMMAAHLDRPCETHKGWRDCPDVTLHRSGDGTIGIPVRDGLPPETAGSVIAIAHCPWCGAPLSDGSAGFMRIDRPSSYELANLFQFALKGLTAANLYGLARPESPHEEDEFNGEAMEIARLAILEATGPDDVADIVRETITDGFSRRAANELDVTALGQRIWIELNHWRHA